MGKAGNCEQKCRDLFDLNYLKIKAFFTLFILYITTIYYDLNTILYFLKLTLFV